MMSTQESLPFCASQDPDFRARIIVRVDPHLVAARKLAKKIRRMPDRSREQTQAGQAICQHLKAMLQERSSSE